MLLIKDLKRFMKNITQEINKVRLSDKFILLLGIVLIFIIVFSFLAIKRVYTLNSYYYDLGIMDQVVYNTSKGRFLEMTNQDFMRNMSRLAIHFDPILAIFAPFYWFFPSFEVLLIGQVVIVGLGALGIYLLSQIIIKKPNISLLFSILYLLYFPVQRQILFDFHAVTLATTFLIFSLYFLEIKNFFWFYFFIFLSLLTKEHIGLIIMFLGLYVFFIKKEKKVGLTTFFLGSIFFISTVYFIIPYFRGEDHFASHYFSDLHLRYKDIIFNGIEYTKKILLGNLYSFFAPYQLLIALPEWAINTFSLNNNQRAIYFHYQAIIIVFVFYSLIYGYKNFDKVIKNQLTKKMFFIIFLLLNIYSIYLYNPLPYFFVKQPVKFKEINPINYQSIKLWREKLKDENIKLSTTPKLAPFFTNRKYYHNFLYDPAFGQMGYTEKDIIKQINDYKNSDYVIIYRPEIGDIDKGGLPVKFYQRLKEDKNFQMVYSDNLNENSIEVYKKITK